MINWVLSTAESMGWPKQALHHEEFLAPGTGLPFDRRTGGKWQDHHRRHHQSPA
jgi:hypothetical protein